ncbi:hypothetical protein AAH994_10795 [Weeksellaceae bacterium A-14]
MNLSVPAIKNAELFTNVYMREFVNDENDGLKEKYNSFENSSFKGFMMAKNSQFIESSIEFEKIESTIFQDDIRSDFLLVLQDTVYPKKAYLYYKQGKINLAKYLTYKSILINQYLKIEKKTQLPTFIQIQQYHNLSRIYFKNESFSKGLQLSCKILLFLFTGKSVGLKYLDDYALLDKVEESTLKCNMIYQVLFDVIQILNKSRNQNAKLIFTRFLYEVQPFFITTSDEEKILFDVLMVVAIYSQDISRFRMERENIVEKYGAKLFPNTEKILKLL